MSILYGIVQTANKFARIGRYNQDSRCHRVPAVLFTGIVSVVHARGGTDGTPVSASDPRDFNSYYAPAYRLPDPATMPLPAACDKELIHSTYKYLGEESGIRAANGRPFVGNTLACTNLLWRLK